MENQSKKRQELIDIRLAKGLTQQEVADSAGISREYYNQIENGARTPKLDHIKTICTALGIAESIKWF